MVQYIKQFFDSLLGIAMPDVVYQIFGLCAVFLMFRALFTIVNVKGKYFNFAYYVSVILIALGALGGMQWSFSL